jgi:hypothetical protein
MLGMWARVCVARLPRMRAAAPSSWTGCDVDECFGVCVRCVMVWSDAAACMGVVRCVVELSVECACGRGLNIWS